MLRESLQKRHVTSSLGWTMGPATSRASCAPWGGSLPAPTHQPTSALTFSKTPEVAGQLEGSWHTHMGELLSSTSHTLPCLQ